MFEKIVNSKAYEIVDKIVAIVWINILMLVTMIMGLFVFTFGTSIMAGTYVIKLRSQKYEGPILPVYIKAFKKFYIKTTAVSLVNFVVMLIIGFNIYFFIEIMENDFTWFSYFSFILMFIVFIINLITMIHAMLLSTCFPSSSVGTLLSSGLKLTFAFIFRSILMLIVIIGLFVITWIVPILAFLLTFYLIALSTEYLIFKNYDKVNIFSNVSNEIANELLL